MVLKQYVLDAFNVIGVSPSTGFDDALKAYKRLALAHHPDRNHGKEKAATARFQEIGAAWDIVSKHYDNPHRSETTAGPFYDDDDDDEWDAEVRAAYYDFMFYEIFMRQQHGYSGFHSRRNGFRSYKQSAYGPTFNFYAHPFDSDPSYTSSGNRKRYTSDYQPSNEWCQREEQEKFEQRVREFEAECAAQEAEKKEMERQRLLEVERQASAQAEAFALARSGNSQGVQALIIKHSLDITAPEKIPKQPKKVPPKNYNTLLHVVASKCNEELIAFLLDKGADVTAVNQGGLTPFHQAILSGNTPAVRFFLSRRGKSSDSCHPSKALADGRTPLQLAIASGSVSTVELMLKDATVHDVERCWEQPALPVILKGILVTKKGFVPRTAPDGHPISRKAAIKAEAAREAAVKHEEKMRRIADEQARAAENLRRKEERSAKRQAEERIKEAARMKAEEEERLRAEVARLAAEEERQRVEAARLAAKEAECQRAEKARLAAEQAKLQAEKEARRKTEEARRLAAEEEERRCAEEEAKQQAAYEARRIAEMEARLKTEREARRRAEMDVKRRADQEERRKVLEMEARQRLVVETRQREIEKQVELERKAELQRAAERQREAEARQKEIVDRRRREVEERHMVQAAKSECDVQQTAKAQTKQGRRPEMDAEAKRAETLRRLQAQAEEHERLKRQRQQATPQSAVASGLPTTVTADPKMEAIMRRRAEQSARDKARHQLLKEERALLKANRRDEDGSARDAEPPKKRQVKVEKAGKVEDDQRQAMYPLTPVSLSSSPTSWLVEALEKNSSSKFAPMTPPMTPEDLQTCAIPDDLFAYVPPKARSVSSSCSSPGLSVPGYRRGRGRGRGGESGRGSGLRGRGRGGRDAEQKLAEKDQEIERLSAELAKYVGRQ